jgi:hypothetical protein
MPQQSQPSYPENQEMAGNQIFTSQFVIKIVREMFLVSSIYIFERVIW